MKNLSELKLKPGETLFLDRIEEGVATLLLGPDGAREENVPRDQLPSDAAEGQRLRVRPDGVLEIDHEATRAGLDATAALIAELLSGAHLAAPGEAPADHKPQSPDKS